MTVGTGRESLSASERTAGELKVQFFHGEDDPPRFFIVINQEDQPIERFQITTFLPPVDGNILLQEYSFSKEITAIEKSASVNIAAGELKNKNGERLSDSKKRVGVVHLMGKVGETPKGTMMLISK